MKERKRGSKKLIIGGFVLLFILAGCNLVSCKRVFYADFNAEALDTHPSADPQGKPSDDSIKFSAGNAKIINSNLIYSKSLEFTRGNSDVTPYVEFITGNKTHTTNFYRVTFEAYTMYITDIPALTIFFSSSNGNDALQLILKSGSFILNSGDGREIIGSYRANKLHTISVIIDKEKKTSGIVITQEGQQAIAVDEKPFLNNAFAGLDKIRMEYPPAIVEALPGIYVIDDLVVSKKSE